MSATKKRNLRKKIITCFCIVAIAANMTAVPVVPVISDVGVISASAATTATVHFHTNNNGESFYDDVDVNVGDTVSAPADPSYSGATFVGWYTDEQLTQAYDFNTPVTGNLDLYAKWRFDIDLNSVLAGYVADPNGYAAPPGVTVQYARTHDFNTSTIRSIVEITLTNGDYTFTGSNNVNGANLDVKFIVPSYVTANVNFNGASIINDEGACGTDGSLDTSYSGKYLDEPNCDVYVCGYVVPFSVEGTLNVTGDISIDTLAYYFTNYAGTRFSGSIPYKEGSGTFNPNFFNVTYVDEDGNTVDTNYYMNGKTYGAEPSDYLGSAGSSSRSKITDTFKCMTISDGNGGKLPFTGENRNVNKNTDVTVKTAHTDANDNNACDLCGEQVDEVYTVTFETNGGTDVDSENVRSGRTASKPTAPTKSRYLFKGWYTDAALTTPYNFAAPVTENFTLYAKWEEKVLDSISVSTPPNDVDYIEYQTFDPTGLVITLNFEEGASETVAYSDEADAFTFTPSLNTALATTDTAVTIGYGGKTTIQTITVAERSITGISVATPPTTTSYVEYQTFDPTGLVLNVTYNSGAPTTVAYNEQTASAFTFTPSLNTALATTDTAVTIGYGGKTTTQTITVAERSITGISVATPPTTTSYVEYQTFDPTGLVLNVTYNSGAPTTVAYNEQTASAFTFTPSLNTALATTDTAVTIGYGGKSTTQAITVAARSITGISVATPPTTTRYGEGDHFDPTGLVLTVTYDAGEPTAVEYSSLNAGEFTFTPDLTDELTLNDTSVTIGYGGQTTTQDISVSVKTLVSISVATPPVKTRYAEGDSFDPTGLVIRLNYDVGTPDTVAYSELNAAEFTFTPDTSAILGLGDTAVTITYNGMSAQLAIIVGDDTNDDEDDDNQPDPEPAPVPTYPILHRAEPGHIFNYVFPESIVSRPMLTVSSEVNKDSVTLTWNEVKKADSYTVYQYVDGKYVKVTETTDTSVTISGLKNGKSYNFIVKYTLNGRISSSSNAGRAFVNIYYKPIVTATAGENSAKLKWKPVKGAEKYAIYKYVDGKAVKLAETSKCAVNISGLASDTKYQYIVRAYVDGEWTTMMRSDIVTVTTK